MSRPFMKLKPDQVETLHPYQNAEPNSCTNMWLEQECEHPEHNPPIIIQVKPGEILYHICPYCRKESTIV